LVSTIIKPSELLRRALRWISERRRLDAAANVARLIDEAGRQFNLSPQDQETLWHLLKGEDKTAGATNDR
jgi:hypothetical protein